MPESLFLKYKYNQNNATMESQTNQMSCILICYLLKQNSTDGLQIFNIIILAFWNTSSDTD